MPFGSLKFHPSLLFLCLMTMFSLVMPRVAVLPVTMATTRRLSSLRVFARQHKTKSSLIARSLSPKTALFLSCSCSCSLIGMRGGAAVTPDTWRLHSTSSPTPTSTTEAPLFRHRAYLAVGSNLGDRFQNIQNALTMLCCESSSSSSSENEISTAPPQIRLIRTSYLHETAPMYVTDQPSFLNGAVELETDLEPHELLRRIKVVEAMVGRDLEGGMRNGPRPVDLDILLYETRHDDDDDPDGFDRTRNARWKPFLTDTPDLVIPHARIQEREFVLAPLCEAAGRDLIHPVLNETIGDLCSRLQLQAEASSSLEEPEPPMVRVLPLARGRMLCFNETIVMGILNVTPDSFSDGGHWSSSVEQAALRALEMVKEGAGIIDIGGESTRPGAKEVAVEEEIQRTIAVIERIRQESDIPISIDTRRAHVARLAVGAGADIVNDVSGGLFDPSMLATVAELGVPMVLMHMRGTPETMQSMTEYDNVVTNVAASLNERSQAAESAGIQRWMQILDPGIGFAKDLQGNLLLLKSMPEIRSITGNVPLLLGTSRKGFIGKLTGVADAKDRDPGTIASTVAAICIGEQAGSCNIVRVHNVADTKQGIIVMDAIRNAK